MPAIEPNLRTPAALVSLRRDLHAHPELAFAEHRTAGIVADGLRALGLEVHAGIGGTGVVGVLHGAHKGSGGSGSPPAIGLRADMDALPITERNTFAHRSRHEGKMHACGHDGHTAMLLGAAAALAARADFQGTVYFVFQPAEEGEGGAQAMIDDGLFERFPMQAMYGLHNWPGLPAGDVAVHRGAVMACADRFDIEIQGQGGHAAMPHLGTDAVLAGADLVQALQSIVSRSLAPVEAAVVSVTQFHAGEAYNAIPEQARLCGTVRAFSASAQNTIEQRLSELCTGVGLAHGVRIECTYRRGYPATTNTAAEADLCLAAARSLLAPERVHVDPPPSMGAEDFAYFLAHVPGCYVWLGNGRLDGSGHAGDACTLHNPRYDFNDEILPAGVAYWEALVRQVLAAPCPEPAVQTEPTEARP